MMGYYLKSIQSNHPDFGGVIPLNGGSRRTLKQDSVNPIRSIIENLMLNRNQIDRTASFSTTNLVLNLTCTWLQNPTNLNFDFNKNLYVGMKSQVSIPLVSFTAAMWV